MVYSHVKTSLNFSIKLNSLEMFRLAGKKISYSRKSSSVGYTFKFGSIEPETNDVLSVLREYLKSTHKNLEEVFQAIDITKCGKVTNLEFKEAIRKLMTGLTSREIDELLNATPMDSDNRISYKDFIRKMNET